MQKHISTLIGLTVTFFNVFAQAPTKKEIKEAWKNIPSNIEECINRLEIIYSDSAKIYFANKNEAKAVAEFNMMQGMSIRNNWKLWKGSELSKYFNSYQVYHPEDMTYFIFTSYHRKLNNRPIDFNGQLTEYFALIERLKANPPKLTDNFKPGDTVVTNRFESKNIVKDLLGKQPGYSITALVQVIDTVNQKFRLIILEIRSTTTKDKKEVAQINFDKQLVSKGTELWTDVDWWRKKGQIIQLHVEQ